MLATSLGTVVLSPEVQEKIYRNLNDTQKGAILNKLVYNQGAAQVSSTPWKIKNLAKWAQESISMFTLILGRDDDAIVDESLVAILDLYHSRPAPSFRYAEALAVNIRQQLRNFQTDRVFRYVSYFVYMFIFYQNAHLYHLDMQQFKDGKPTKCVHWLPWVKKGETESSLLKYINEFMFVAFSVITERFPNMIPDDIRPYLFLFKGNAHEVQFNPSHT
uniref:Uncharacterized protein n=1 Tax=Picea glauca TaxID=3330 RepID=A0A101LYD0_PICGL|nr:hypothetical protein ABT39_MTgene5791 [Picea glauca]QHR90433.1 hypothetical protein Q903MT_gene4457 [Picea sitchensis]